MADNEYGLSENGFRRKRLPEIIQGLNDRMSDSLGLPIQTSANSVFGQIHGVYGNALAEIWEQLEKIYYAMYPLTADGVSLSNSAALAGISQISAEQTVLVATCYGLEKSHIPYGALIASSIDTSMVFRNREVLRFISATQACEIYLSIPSATVGNVYMINLDGKQYSYAATDDDTGIDILEKIMEQFDFDDRTAEIKDSTLIIKMNDPADVFSLSTTTVNIDLIGTPYLFECINFGAIDPPIGKVDQIITNYSGWTAVSNNKEASVGREAETDTELRQRWSLSVYGRGAAMTDSIAAAIYQECTGVTAVKVYENTSDVEDADGRPPHSVEAVVEGGDPQEICDVLFTKKAAGIDTFGEIKRVVVDSQAIAHDIYFNRPTELKIWLKIEVSTDDKEDAEAFGGLQNIKSAVLEMGQSFGVGQDVIIQKFYAAIYENVTGIGYVRILTAVGDTPSEYKEKNVRVDVRHYATFDDSRIEVAET